MFKENDIVMINPNSEYREQGYRNGVLLKGIVEEVSSGEDHCYFVEWLDPTTRSSISRNCYRIIDLLPLKNFKNLIKVPIGKVLISINLKHFPEIVKLMNDPFVPIFDNLKKPIGKERLHYLKREGKSIVESKSVKNYVKENIYMITKGELQLLESKIYSNGLYPKFDRVNKFLNPFNNAGAITLYTKI